MKFTGVLLLFMLSVLRLSGQESVAPFSYWLRGSIGKKAIEMRLVLAFDQVGQPCASVRGCYYEAGQEPVELSGKYWYKDKKMDLLGKGDNDEEFTFSFFDGNKGDGEWREAELLEVVKLEAIVAADKQAFLEGAKVAMPDLELLAEQKIRLVKPDDLPTYFEWHVAEYARGGYIVLDFTEEYVSRQQIFALLSGPKMKAIEVEQMNAYTPSYDEEGNQIPDYSTSLSYTIWAYDAAKRVWKAEFTEVLIDEPSISPEARVFNLQVGEKGLYIERADDAGDKKSIYWRWNGKKMIKK